MKILKRLFLAFMITALAAGSFSGISVKASGGKPKKVSIKKSSMKVGKGKEFEIKAKVSPKSADDDYLRWEIISGKKYVRFEDSDRDGDEMDFVAKKPGKAKIRCYIKGRSKKKYGDVITVYVKKKVADYSLKRDGSSTKYEELHDDFELEVKKGDSIKNSQLKWSIQDTSIVGFNQRSKTGKEVEFIAKKTGTTTVTCTCTNKRAKPKKITYTIHVVLDDDYYDDDDDD